MESLCTGVILSGGENNRFGRKNKAFAKVGSVRIINRVYDILSRVFDKIIIVTNDPINYTEFDCLIVTDHYKVRSSLNGIHSGLFASLTDYSFFIACDIPFVNEQLVQFIVNQINIKKDIIIPETTAGLEPIFAIYSKRCLKLIERQIEKQKFQIRSLIDKVRVQKISESEIKKFDPRLLSFFNVNSSSDLISAKKQLIKNNKNF